MSENECGLEWKLEQTQNELELTTMNFLEGCCVCFVVLEPVPEVPTYGAA